jgi:hypothetical protein
MREAVQKLDRAAQDAERERHQLAGLIGTVRKQDEQRNWLLWAASGALVVGLLVSPFVAGLLPFGGDSAVAAVIMKGDRWNAGIALMQVGSPDGCGSIRRRWRLAVRRQIRRRRNSAARSPCRRSRDYTEGAHWFRRQCSYVKVSTLIQLILYGPMAVFMISARFAAT